MRKTINGIVPLEDIQFALHGKYESVKEYEETLMSYIENNDFSGIISYIKEMRAFLDKSTQSNNNSSSEEVKKADAIGKDMSRTLCYVVYEGLNTQQLNWIRRCTDKTIKESHNDETQNAPNLYESLTAILSDRIIDDIVRSQDAEAEFAKVTFNETELSMTMYLAALREAQANNFGNNKPDITHEKNAYSLIVNGINQTYGIAKPEITLSEMLFPTLPTSPSTNLCATQGQG